MEKELYILRHGETEYNRLKIVQGSGVDTSLNETGRAQAKAFYERYQDIPFELVITSALKRSQQTVEAFGKKGIPTAHFSEINEINWGIHEGKKSLPEMIAQYQALMEDWKNGHYEAHLEEGESAAELAQRLKRFLELLKSRPEQRILICTHGRTLRCLMCLIKGDPLSKMNEIPHQNTGLYVVYLEQETFRVVTENDAQHLESLHSAKND
ncbi:MAG: histidine phosphatase family protein [Bacteroidota bacterium]